MPALVNTDTNLVLFKGFSNGLRLRQILRFFVQRLRTYDLCGFVFQLVENRCKLGEKLHGVPRLDLVGSNDGDVEIIHVERGSRRSTTQRLKIGSRYLRRGSPRFSSVWISKTSGLCSCQLGWNVELGLLGLTLKWDGKTRNFLRLVGINYWKNRDSFQILLIQIYLRYSCESLEDQPNLIDVFVNIGIESFASGVERIERIVSLHFGADVKHQVKIISSDIAKAQKAII